MCCRYSIGWVPRLGNARCLGVVPGVEGNLASQGAGAVELAGRTYGGETQVSRPAVFSQEGGQALGRGESF